MGSITTRPVRRYAPPPYYPPAAKAAKQQGKVLLNVDVDAAGNVTGVSVKESSGYPLLDDAAMQAVRVWKFEPARVERCRGGEPHGTVHRVQAATGRSAGGWRSIER